MMLKLPDIEKAQVVISSLKTAGIPCVQRPKSLLH